MKLALICPYDDPLQHFIWLCCNQSNIFIFIGFWKWPKRRRRSRGPRVAEPAYYQASRSTGSDRTKSEVPAFDAHIPFPSRIHGNMLDSGRFYRFFSILRGSTSKAITLLKILGFSWNTVQFIHWIIFYNISFEYKQIRAISSFLWNFEGDRTSERGSPGLSVAESG